MSWQSRDGLFKRLESQVESGTVSLADLLKEDNFLNALGQQLPNLSEFVSKHVKELIEVAIGLKKPDADISSKRYVTALISHNTQLTDAFTKKQEIVNYLVSAVSLNIDFTSYFRILQYAIDSGEFLSKIENPEVFFNALIDKIQNYSVQHFLIVLCSRRSTSNLEWLTKINADRILMERMYSEEQTVYACLLLLNCILKNPDPTELSKRLSVLENFKIIFDTGIDAPTVEIGDLSFRILIQMINAADGTQEDDKKSPFDTIVEALVSCCEKLCSFVSRDKEFFGDKYNAVELIISIIKRQTTTEKCVYETASRLFTMFFEQPTNTFLQLAFKGMFSALLELEDGYEEFLSENKILERLIEEHNKVNGVTKVYHGFIMNMANELSSMVNNKLIKAPEGWDNFIKNVVMPTMKTYKTNYGGRVPVTLIDSIGANAHFIEESDDSDNNDDFEDISLSSSSNPSDEYEEEKNEEDEKEGKDEKNPN